MGRMDPVCKRIRQHILHVSRVSGHGHVPTCFSVVEMLHAVYRHMRHDPKNPTWDGRDFFLLSKGHAALAYYCVLAEAGYFKPEEVETFGHYGSRFGCHADRLKVPGVEVSTGSLGHGLPLAVGVALAQKIRKTDRKVFTLIGDGESNEGTIWESLMVATHQSLSNLTVLFDHNQSQQRSLPIQDPAAKFRAFGCHVIEVDGHSLPELGKALRADPGGKVKMIVADAVKGCGCKTLVDNVFEWHRKSPDESQFKLLLGELDAETV